MSYFKTTSSISTKKEKELFEFIQKRCLIEPYKLNSNAILFKNNLKYSQSTGNSTFKDKLNELTPEQIEALKRLLYVCVKLAVGNMINKFVDVKLNELTVSTLNKHKGNKKLYNYILKTIEDVMKKNPSYRKCSPKEFQETSIWNYFLSEWRDLDVKQFAKRVTYEYIDELISITAADLIPLPGANILLSTPCKMMLTYLGVKLGVGAIYHIVVDIEGYTVSLGISFTKIGFVLSDLRLYLFKEPGNKLVVRDLPDPPRELYELDVSDAKEILDKYGDDKNLDKLKEKVSEINGNN